MAWKPDWKLLMLETVISWELWMTLWASCQSFQMVSTTVLHSASGDWKCGRILVALTTFLTLHFYSHKIADTGFLNYELFFWESEPHFTIWQYDGAILFYLLAGMHRNILYQGRYWGHIIVFPCLFQSENSRINGKE